MVPARYREPVFEIAAAAQAVDAVVLQIVQYPAAVLFLFHGGTFVPGRGPFQRYC